MFNNIIYKSDLFQVAALIKDEDTAQNLRHELRSVLGKLSAVPTDTVDLLFSRVQADVVGVCARRWLELRAAMESSEASQPGVVRDIDRELVQWRYMDANLVGASDLRNAVGGCQRRFPQVRRYTSGGRTDFGEGYAEEFLHRSARPAEWQGTAGLAVFLAQEAYEVECAPLPGDLWENPLAL